MSKLLAISALILATCFGDYALCSSVQRPVVRIGVTNCQEHLYYKEIIESFKKVVTERLLPEADIVFNYFSVDELEKKIKEREIDIFLSSSGFYRMFINQGVRDLATAYGPLSPNPNHGDASTWFTLAKRDDIEGLLDLEGKTVAAKRPNAFAGWHMGLGEISLLGKEPDNFFSLVKFVGWNVQDVFDSVLTGKADAGIIQSCFLERYLSSHPEQRLLFKVLNEKKSEIFPCKHSTDVYPNWTVAITPSMPLEIAKKISSSLLTAEPTEHGLQWGVATRFDKVDDLLRTLKLGPYEYLRVWTVERVLHEFWYLLVVFVGVLFGLCMYIFAANRLVKKRTRQLSIALKKQKEFYQQYELTNKSLTALKKMGMLNQVTSILAHELRQPLNSIVCFSHGLLRMLDENKQSKENFREAVKNIRDKAKNADRIISKIREHVKSNTKKEVLNLSEVIEEAIQNYIMSCDCSEEFVTSLDKNIFVYSDRFEMELLLNNLFRNASEALKNTPNGKIWVYLTMESEKVRLIVEDNGPITSEKDMVGIMNPLLSQKESGMGLGLSVVRDIMTIHNGEIYFEPRRPRGLRVIMFFQSLSNEKK